MKRALAASLAAVLFLMCVGYANAAQQRYTLSVEQANGEATFTVTRTRERVTRTEWLALDCYQGWWEVFDTEIPVSWDAGLVGHAGPLPVSGDWCEAAVVTTLDYEPQHHDPVVVFDVP